ncbi:hypothetical protein TRVL_05951 [Trypanosoma vivax]|nr:hypothetical protein TRVL_05951 [Trypanosoma vivax]
MSAHIQREARDCNSQTEPHAFLYPQLSLFPFYVQRLLSHVNWNSFSCRTIPRLSFYISILMAASAKAGAVSMAPTDTQPSTSLVSPCLMIPSRHCPSHFFP